MKRTQDKLIVTADDFPLGAVADTECEQLREGLGIGKHLYGGKFYHGHHVVITKRALRRVPINQKTIPALSKLASFL